MSNDRQMNQDRGMPRVSVVMAVRDGERFVNAAVDSVLAQTFRDFELIIVDDGSSDSTPHLLARYSDPRVQVLRNEQNQGLAAALNRGIEQTRGAYIARMDADDEALPERLSTQVDFLDRHPEIGILGAGFKKIDAESHHKGTVSWPSEDVAIRWMILLTAPFLHSSVMMRSEILDKHELKYDESYRTAQDYELWTRVLEVTNAANVPEVLVLYRIHDNSINRNKRGEQLRNHDAIALRTIRTILGSDAAAPNEVTALRRMFIGCAEDEPEPERGERIELARLYLDLLKRFVAGREDAKGVKALYRSEVRRVAYKVFRHPPFLSGWIGLAARMSMMDWSFPFWMVASALKSMLPERTA